MLALMRRRSARAAQHRRPAWPSLLSGFRFVLRHRIVLGAISLDMFAVLLGGAMALMPIFARDILGPGLGAGHAAGGAGGRRADHLDLAGEAGR